MNDLIKLTVLADLLVLLALYLSGKATEKKTDMFYAQAYVIQAQNEARKDLMAGMLPYTLLGLGVIGLTAITVVIS